VGSGGFAMSRARKIEPASGIERWVPGLAVARRYQRSWLRGDLVAGLVLAALLVPQGMAYAKLAGLPAVYGLYATMVPLIVYAVLGPSRILVLGPDSAVAPVVAAAIIPIAGNDTGERVALAGLLAVLVGVACIAGGIAGFGFLTDLISKPIRIGYLAGIAVSVIVGQLPGLLGFDVNGSGIASDLSGLARHLDQTDTQSLLLGGGALVFMLVVRRIDSRIPGALVAVVVSSALVLVLDLTVETVGAIPGGLPQFTVPNPSSGDLGRLTLTALALALLAFADTSVLSRSYASRFGTEVEQDQELRSLGAANLATGFFQGFPISSSSSRTPVAEAAGAKTQLTGLIGALSLGAILVFANGLFRDLPTSVLAAIVIAAMIGLIDLAAARRLAQVDRTDFTLALTCFGGVAVFGVLWGIGIAIGLSVLTFLWRAWHPYDAVLGRATGVKGYHDITRYPEARQVPGLILYRFDAPLFFANANIFRARILAAVQDSPVPARTVVVAAEPITDLDSTAADMLTELDRELETQGVELAFAELKDPVKDRLRRFGLVERIGHERFYPTIGVAVRRFVEEHRVDWVDWEEAEEWVPVANAGN
jgi:high affinity sulfate transporter 1